MKPLSLFLLVFFLTLNCKAQQGILFKIKYLPKHSYNSIIHSGLNMEMDFDGTQQQKDSIKKTGAPFPVIMTAESDINTIATTGSVNSQKFFPYTLKYVDVKSKRVVNGEEVNTKSPLVGQIAYGHTDPDGLAQVDSIPGKTLDDATKKAIAGTINSVRQQIKFPDQPIKVGGTFSQEIPLNLPVSGMDMQMKIRMVYKLISITDNKAFFDIDESLSFDMSMVKNETEMIATGSGKGIGKLIYSITDNYPLEIDTNLDFDFKMGIKDFKMIAKAKMTMTHKSTIASL